MYNWTVLNDRSAVIDGLNIYGSPWTLEYKTWAFMKPPGEKMREVWSMIPENTDILITHGPPYGIMDTNEDGVHCGCEELLKAVQRIKPKLHVFGHIHESYGIEKQDGTTFVNAAVYEGYKKVKDPIVIDWESL